MTIEDGLPFKAPAIKREGDLILGDFRTHYEYRPPEWVPLPDLDRWWHKPLIWLRLRKPGGYMMPAGWEVSMVVMAARLPVGMREHMGVVTVTPNEVGSQTFVPLYATDRDPEWAIKAEGMLRDSIMKYLTEKLPPSIIQGSKQGE